MNYAEWLKETYKIELSPLGEKVATILGTVWQGLYHIQSNLKKVDWKNPEYIEINIESPQLATWDYNRLTQLVVLCHDNCIRMSVEPCNFRILKFYFHQRKGRTGHGWERHPSLEDHIKMIREQSEQLRSA